MYIVLSRLKLLGLIDEGEEGEEQGDWVLLPRPPPDHSNMISSETSSNLDNLSNLQKVVEYKKIIPGQNGGLIVPIIYISLVNW